MSNDPPDIRGALAYAGITLRSYGAGGHKTLCPRCSANRKAGNRKDPCLSVTIEADGASWFCHNCSWATPTAKDDPEYYKALYPRGNSASPASKGPEEPPPHGVAGKPKAESAAKTETPQSPLQYNPEGPRASAFFGPRKIPPAIVARNGITIKKVWMPGPDKEMSCVAFPYYRDGNVANIKYRSKDKRFRQEKGREKIFYGLDTISTHDTVIITEGEMDALSLQVVGLHETMGVLSVPDGAPMKVKDEEIDQENDTAFSYVWNCWRHFENVKKIILAGDADGPGRALVEELARRFGKERCWRVSWPTLNDATLKDANEVLVEQGPDVLRECIEAAKPYPIQSLYRASDFHDDVMRVHAQGRQRGLSTGWVKLDEYMTVAPGMFTVITGQPGAGKSNFIDAMTINLATEHGWTFAMCSFENHPGEDHIPALIEKHTGQPFWGTADKLSTFEVDAAEKWIDQHYHFIATEDDSPTIDWILEKAKAAVARYGINALVIDPYSEIEHKRPRNVSETEYISGVIGKCKRFARNNGVHVFFIAHPAKMARGPDGEVPVPSLWDISGCYSEDTEVLTAAGWKPHADVTAQDEVCCFDPDENVLRYESPTYTHVFDHDGEMHHYTGYSLDLLVTPEHRMVAQAGWKRPGKKLGNENLGRPDTWSHIGWQFAPSKDLKHANYRIPLAATLVRSAPSPRLALDREYDEDALWAFVGWYVSEGWVSMGAPAVCQAAENAQQIQKIIQKLRIAYSEAFDHYRAHEKPMWRARIRRRKQTVFCDWIINSCGQGCTNKHLPDETWSLPTRIKRILFDTLISGDGNRRKHDPLRRRQGGYQYSTTSSLLADQVQRLAIELGMYATVSSLGRAKPHHKDRHSVTIGHPNRTERVITLPRNRTFVAYTGKVYCLTVPTGAYVTRRNGKMAICGNSAHWANKADLGIVVNPLFDVQDGALCRMAATEIFIRKVRFRWLGKIGKVTLYYDSRNSRYTEEMY